MLMTMKKKPLQMSCFRRGDIVWTRALYPHSWCPALVLRTDIFGVLVSFFDSDPPPRYFLESQVCSFRQNFQSLVQTVEHGTPCDRILNQALILLGQRAALSLKCPCLEPAQHYAEAENLESVGWECKEQVLEEANRFLPEEALGFVLRMAVSPWIEDEDLVVALTASSKIMRFRCYSSVMYRKRRELEDNVTMPSAAQGVASPGDDCQLLSEQMDYNNLTDSATNGANMKESLKSLHKAGINHLQLKRQLEQPPLVHPCSKLRKTKPFFSLSRAYAYLQKNGGSVRIDIFDAFSSWSLLMLDIPLIENTSDYSSVVDLGNIPQREENVDSVNDAATCISYVNTLEAQGSSNNLQDNVKGSWNANVNVDCIPGFLQPSASKSQHKSVFGNHASDEEVGDAIVASTKFLLPDLNIDPDKIQSRDNVCGSSVTNIIGEVNEVCSLEKYKKNKKLHQPVTADSSFNSQIHQQPQAPNYGHSRVLHMKFPKGYDLPSKKELIKKFRPFGSLDLLNVKVSPYTGAARVVFLEHTDAVTAYQYAKRKKVFAGEANIRFWLDPFDHKRGVNFLSPLPSSNLKPCLKISSSLEKDEKKARRVKFVPDEKLNQSVAEFLVLAGCRN